MFVLRISRCGDGSVEIVLVPRPRKLQVDDVRIKKSTRTRDEHEDEDEFRRIPATRNSKFKFRYPLPGPIQHLVKLIHYLFDTYVGHTFSGMQRAFFLITGHTVKLRLNHEVFTTIGRCSYR